MQWFYNELVEVAGPLGLLVAERRAKIPRAAARERATFLATR